MPHHRLITLIIATLCCMLSTAFGCSESGDSGGSSETAGASSRHHRHHDGDAGADDHKHDKDKRGDHGGKDDGKKDDKNDDHGDKSGASPDSKKDDAHQHGHRAPGATAFYVSMHGAEGGNTIVGITAKGEVKGSVLRGAPAGEAGDSLKDLRGMCLLGDGSLLVVNAWMQDTRIVQFGKPGADGVRDFERVFIQGGSDNPGLVHTYAVVVAPDGSVYCSNQDTNTVTRYAGPGSATPGKPLPIPQALSNFGNLAPGTFIPNSKTSPEGLVEVRGIAFGADGTLYVADRSASRVSAYDPKTGERTSVIASEKDGLKHPIQLTFSPDGRYLYIGDNLAHCVWRKDFDSGEFTKFIASGTGGLEAPSALVATTSHLMVGNRKQKSILRFRLPEGKLDPHPFVEKLPDDPEFLLFLD